MISIPVIAGGVVVVMSAFGSYKLTANIYEAKLSKIEAEAAKASFFAESKNRQIELLGLELMGVVSERNAARNQKHEVVERIVTKKVIEYVQNPDAGKCDIPNEFVQLHDTAATGGGMSETTETSGPIDASPTGVTDTEVILIVTENYSTCHNTRNQLLSLQEWVTLSLAIDKTAKTEG